MKKEDWEEISEDVFQKVFKNSAVKRTKLKGLKRNIDFLKQLAIETGPLVLNPPLEQAGQRNIYKPFLNLSASNLNISSFTGPAGSLSLDLNVLFSGLL